MNKRFLWPIAAFSVAALCVAVISLITGCEDNTTHSDLGRPPSVSELTITPSETSISATNTYAVFRASGGKPPYLWTVSDAALGTVPSTTVGTITYTRVADAGGANVLTVVDQNGWKATAIISQE